MLLVTGEEDGEGENSGCAVRGSRVSEGAGDGVRCMKRPWLRPMEPEGKRSSRRLDIVL